jgi:RNA-binding protein
VVLSGECRWEAIVEMTSKHVLRRIRREFSPERPTIWVGKNGVTLDMIEQARKQLESREVVKVRLHQSVPQATEEIARLMAAETQSEVADVRGGSFILYKPLVREWKTGKTVGEDEL